MKVGFNTVNPSFNGCYKLPRTEYIKWQDILHKNTNLEFEEVLLSMVAGLNNTQLNVKFFDKDQKTAVMVASFLGKHPFDFVIQDIKGKIFFIPSTKEERKALNIKRGKYTYELNNYRLRKAKSAGIDYAGLFNKDSRDGIYIFTDEKKDAGDFFSYMNQANRIYSKYAKKHVSFWQRIRDKFKPDFYDAFKELVEHNQLQQKAFDEFIAGKEVKEFDTAEELAKEVFPA